MKIIKVEYLEESSEAIFANVTTEETTFFGKVKRETRKCYLEKWKQFGPYAPFVYFCNNGKHHPLYGAVKKEMVLQYEKQATEL